VVISGKLRAARAKAMKFRDGYMIKSGDAVNHYVDYAVRSIELKQGVLGIKVKIQLPHDPTGKDGVSTKLPDVVTVNDPKEDISSLPSVPAKQGFAQNVNQNLSADGGANNLQQQQQQASQAVSTTADAQ